MKKSYVFSILIFLSNSLLSQRISNDFLPRVIPASPETAALQRFATYPVNMFSGLPEISIPIYTIEVNGMKVPIALSYHASGFRVMEQSGWVGLGWTLTAGGAISRNVMGLPDEKQGYLNGTGSYQIKMTGYNQFNSSQDLQDLRFFYERRLDAEPDVYSYSFPGASGQFYYANRDKNQPVMIPYSPIKIGTTISNDKLSFSVLDDKGIEYRMGYWEEATTPSSTPSSMVTSWPLQYMISVNKKDTIEFSYSSNAYGSLQENVDYVRVVDHIVGAGTAQGQPFANRYSPDQGSPTTSSQSAMIAGLNVQEIKYRTGKIVFEKAGFNRADINTTKALGKVHVYSKDPLSGAYTLIKSVQLNTSYFNLTGSTAPFRLRLDGVDFLDKTGAAIEKYSFNYRQDINIGATYAMSRDYWGFYNGKPNNSLVPRQDIQFCGNEGYICETRTIGSDVPNGRDPDPAYNQVFVLNKVTFPTGGYNELEYETNQYYDAPTNSTKYSGGLRIKQIRSYQKDGTLALKKTYKYGAGETGRGSIIIPVSLRLFNTEQREQPCYDVDWYYCRVRNYVSEPSIGLSPFEGTPVGYEEVTEYEGDNVTNSGKTVYKYEFAQDAFTSLYQYNRPNVVSYHFRRGLLYEKASYRKNTDGSYKMLHKVTNQYEAFPGSTTGAVNVVVFEHVIYDDGTSCIHPTSGFSTQPFDFNSYSIATGDNKLTKTTESVFNTVDNNYLTKVTDYLYENQSHQQITKIKTTSSKGDLFITENKYAIDFVSDPTLGTVASSMITANMLSYPIEQSAYKNAVSTANFLESSKTFYKNWGNSIIAPEYIQAKRLSGAYETRARFFGYDEKGNLLSVSKENDVLKSYLWGYNKTFPIAEVINAKNNEAMFNSFEEGGWDGALTAYDAANKRSGKYSGRIDKPTAGEQVCMSTNWLNIALSTPTKFKYSGWFYSTASSAEIFLFMKTANETGYYTHVTSVSNSTTNKWVYMEGEYTVPANITQLNIRIDNNGSGTVWFDDIRLHPSAAQMTTYTYDPLIGMTSKSDINNDITYFRYDAFGRLAFVMDKDNKILKRYCYNYAGQQENCTINLSPQWANTGNFRCVKDGSNNNTGAQEREEKDNNPMSESYGATRWVGNGTNLTSCPIPNQVTVSGSSYVTSNYYVRFTNTATSAMYEMNLAPNSSNQLQLPAGNYNVQFYPGGSPITATFVVNGYSQYTYAGATFYNVYVGANSYAQIYY